ncbi:sulfotransferase-like domain-containing protein [Acidihalobacter prosperus]|uniref:sulfotransferase-like domain-containing protein n=1 Tax=Acidihalobacter prosperus TaxID=160660 RepID=UPI0005089FCB|nr:hypothetical protein [Acidihalobacter prosperus]
MSYPVVFLWCVPRSVSTAFEKMVDNRGDFKVYGEPFITPYKLFASGRVAESMTDIEKVVEHLKEASCSSPVFVKEMTYHMKPFHNFSFPDNVIHSFLIRHPKFVLPSLYKMRENFTYEETGYEESFRFYNTLMHGTGTAPLVIDGQSLREYPQEVVRHYFESLGLDPKLESLRWNYGSRPEWQDREDWHALANKSNGFVAQGETAFEILEQPRIRIIYDNCLAFYRELKKGVAYEHKTDRQ